MLYYVPIIKVDERTDERTEFLGGVFLDAADEDDASRRACRIARRDKGDPSLILDTVVTPYGAGKTIKAAGKDRLLSGPELQRFGKFDAHMLVGPDGSIKLWRKAPIQ